MAPLSEPNQTSGRRRRMARTHLSTISRDAAGPRPDRRRLPRWLRRPYAGRGPGRFPRGPAGPSARPADVTASRRRPCRTASASSSSTVRVEKQRRATSVMPIMGTSVVASSSGLASVMRERADRRPAQRGEVPAGAQGGAQVAGQRPHVGAGAALDDHVEIDLSRRPRVGPVTSKRLTRTGRAASATSSPPRTRAYERTPSTLIADTDDGTCEIGPRSGSTAPRWRRRSCRRTGRGRPPHPRRRR